MTQVLEELVSKWTLETDLTPLELAQKSVAGLAVSVGAIAATVGAAAGALFGIARATAAAGEEAQNAALKYNLTSKAFQELQYAARGDKELLSGGLMFLNKNLENAVSGSKEAAKAFAALGVATSDASGIRDTDEVLMDLADKFKNMPADAYRTAAAMDIFGKSGAHLIPFLTKGRDEIARLRAEASEFGYVIEDTAAASAFNDAMVDLQNIGRGLRNLLGAELMPVITELMGEMKEWVRENKELIKSDLLDFLRGTIHFVKVLGGVLGKLARATNMIVKIFGGWKIVLGAVAIALGALGTVMALSAIGGLTVAVYGAVTSFFALLSVLNLSMWGFIKLYAVALAPWALIGAAVVGFLLVLEDLWTAIEGGDSVFGNLFEWMSHLFGMMPGWGKAIVTFLLTPFRLVSESVKGLVDLIKVLTGQKGLGEWFSGVGKGVGRILGLDSKGKWIGSDLKGAAGFGTDKPNVGAAAGMYPVYEPAVGAPSTSKSLEQPTTINQNINIGGDAGNALATGKQVGNATENALNRRNRQAGRTFSAQGKY